MAYHPYVDHSGEHLGGLGGAWGALGGSFGGPWGSLGVLGGARGGPWGSPGGPWASLGAPGGVPGGPWELLGGPWGGPGGSQGGRFLTWGGPWAPCGVPTGPHGGPQGSPYGRNTHKINGFHYFSKNEKMALGSPMGGPGGLGPIQMGSGSLPGGDLGPKKKCSGAPGPPKRAPDDQKGFAGDDSVVSGASQGLFLFFIKIHGKYVYFEHMGPSGGPRKSEKMTLCFLGGPRGGLGASSGSLLGHIW